MDSKEEKIIKGLYLADHISPVVRHLVSVKSGVLVDHVLNSDKLRFNLNLDSIDITELVMEIEAHYGFILQDSDVKSCSTVADFISLTQSAWNKKCIEYKSEK